jgi:hypothetical protein
MAEDELVWPRAKEPKLATVNRRILDRKSFISRVTY